MRQILKNSKYTNLYKKKIQQFIMKQSNRQQPSLKRKPLKGQVNRQIKFISNNRILDQSSPVSLPSSYTQLSKNTNTQINVYTSSSNHPQQQQQNPNNNSNSNLNINSNNNIHNISTNIKSKIKQNQSILNVSLIEGSSFISNKQDGSLDSMDKMLIGATAIGIDQKEFEEESQSDGNGNYGKSRGQHEHDQEGDGQVQGYSNSKGEGSDFDFTEIHKQYQRLIGKNQLLGLEQQNYYNEQQQEQQQQISDDLEQDSRVLPDQDDWQLSQLKQHGSLSVSERKLEKLSLSLSPKKYGQPYSYVLGNSNGHGQRDDNTNSKMSSYYNINIHQNSQIQAPTTTYPHHNNNNISPYNNHNQLKSQLQKIQLKIEQLKTHSHINMNMNSHSSTSSIINSNSIQNITSNLGTTAPSSSNSQTININLITNIVNSSTGIGPKKMQDKDISNNSIKILVGNLGNLSQIHQQRQNYDYNTNNNSIDMDNDRKRNNNNQQDQQDFIDFVRQPDPQQNHQGQNQAQENIENIIPKKSYFPDQNLVNQWEVNPMFDNLELQLQKSKSKQNKKNQKSANYQQILQALNSKQQEQLEEETPFYLEMMEFFNKRQNWVKQNKEKSQNWKKKQMSLLNKMKKIIRNPHYDSQDSQGQ